MTTMNPMMMTLAEAQGLLPDATRVGDWLTPVARVHTDTRTLQRGDLFVALKGERFDAHDFLAQARDAGAAAVLSERPIDALGLPGLVVPDTLAALQTLALEWRRRFTLPLVAVTGSNGKTTVTQMIASILRAWVGDAALATAGNLNNHIGVPLTLLALRDAHRAAVVELGMNHPGEIGLLAQLALPNVALVNNAQREHQEFMASVEAVARENGAVLEALGPTGAAVFPADDAHTPLWRALADRRPVLTFALRHADADIRGDARWQAARAHWALEVHTPVGELPVMLRAPGEHNLRNALAATACALAAGAPLAAIRAGLEAFEPVKGRSRVVALKHGATLVDDSYNANPDSVRAAIDLLAGLPGPRWLVLGDMGEVGSRGPEFHAEVGAYARERGLDALWCAGPLCAHAAEAYGSAAHHFADVEHLVHALAGTPPFRSVLVKGSRFMRMERVVQALLDRGGA